MLEKLVERWTPTTIQATFSIHSLSRIREKTAIKLPLLHDLGWSFTLYLTPEFTHSDPWTRYQPVKAISIKNAALSFRQHNTKIPWGNASMRAKLALVMEQHDSGNVTFSEQGTSHDDTDCNYEVLGTIKAALARTPLAEIPLSTFSALSLLRSFKIRLTVTVSDCPFTGGLFRAIPSHVTDADSQEKLVKQTGDRVLGRSLASGKLFDVTFLTPSTLPTSGSTGRFLPSYASFSVLEKHLDPSPGMGECPGGRHNGIDSNVKHAAEIFCPESYEYELDSDFDDEDVSVGPCTSPPPLEQCDTERSNSSLSSFEMGGASDRDLVDNLHEEIIKGPEETSTTDSERTILIRFAAHRTWHAFLWYCYTGRLEFDKLKSQVEPGTLQLRVTHPEDGPPSCSPKSMYRLADLVGDDVLKAKALNAIKERMTETNIMDEAFSIFTSKYPDVREAQVDILKQHCGSSHVKKAFLKAMSKYNGSDMAHAEHVISALFDRVAA